MDLNSIKDYVPYVVEMDTENIKTEQLPGQSQYINGISFFLADEDEIESVVQELFLEKPAEEEASAESNIVNEN